MSYGPRPWLQLHWDVRAALNFIFGGTGGGFLLFAAFVPAPQSAVRAALLLGLALVAAGLAAIGLYSSCLTGHPVVAAVTALAISLVLWMINLATSDPASPLHLVSLLRHFEPFTKGVVDTGNLAYFALLIGLFLVLAIRRLDADRLRG